MTTRSHISRLPLPVLEDLSEALLDFTSIAFTGKSYLQQRTGFWVHLLGVI